MTYMMCSCLGFPLFISSTITEKNQTREKKKVKERRKTTMGCFGSSPSPSPSPTKPTTPPNHHHRPSFSERVQNDTCFRCRNKGHWATNCPFRSPPQSQYQNDTCFRCRNKGHWATNCPDRTPPQSQSQNDTCFNCRNKGHWAADCPDRDTCFHCRNKGHWATNCPFRTPPQSQSQPPQSSIPSPYGQGSCFLRISGSKANSERPYYSCSNVVETDLGSGGGSSSNSNSKAKGDRAPDSFPDCRCGAGTCKLVQEKTDKYFVCPIQKGHGACSFEAAVDDTPPTKTATSRFKEGPGPLIEEIVTENNHHDDILDISTIQEMAMEDGELEDFVTEKSLQISHLTSNAIHRRQVEFLRQIYSSEDAISAGTLITGWLGRLAFPPSGCLTVAPEKPFFCCVFPSFDPISVPKGVDTSSRGEINYQHLSHLNVQPDSSLHIPSQDSQYGVLLELTSIQNISGIRPGRDFMAQISKVLVELHFQKQPLTILESLELCNHKSMIEAANKTFSVLNQLSVDHRSFSERVRKYISCASALAEIQDSMMADQSSEVIMKWYDNERAKFDKISRMQAEIVDAVTASDKRLKSLGEETSCLKEMLLQIEDQLRRCEKENADLKTRLGQISEDMLEFEKKLNDAEAARRLHEERETERNTAKESLERARIQLRQSLFLV